MVDDRLVSHLTSGGPELRGRALRRHRCRGRYNLTLSVAGPLAARGERSQIAAMRLGHCFYCLHLEHLITLLGLHAPGQPRLRACHCNSWLT